MEITGSTVGKGVAVACVGGTGGYGIYTLVSGEEANTETSDQPTQQSTEGSTSNASPKFLFQKADFGTTGDYQKNGGTFGYAFGRFMLDPDENTELWKTKEQNLKNAQIASLSGEFKDFRESKSSLNSIQEVCRVVYKKQKSVVQTSSVSNYMNYDAWIHCSIATHQPYTVNKNVGDKDKYTGKWAKEGNNSEALFGISNTPDNDKPVWNHIYESILKKDIADTNKQNSINSIFKSVDSGDKLRETCQKSYDTIAINSDVDNYGSNVREYCALDLSITLSKYPTAPAT